MRLTVSAVAVVCAFLSVVGCALSYRIDGIDGMVGWYSHIRPSTCGPHATGTKSVPYVVMKQTTSPPDPVVSDGMFAQTV